MIDFKCDESSIERACFSGNLTTITAEVTFMVSLIYGAIHSKNENAGKEFMRAITLSFIDPDIRRHVFSENIAKSLDMLTAIEKEKSDCKKEENKLDKNEFLRMFLEALDESK